MRVGLKTMLKITNFHRSASGALLDQDTDQFSASPVDPRPDDFAGAGRGRVRSADALLLPLRAVQTSGSASFSLDMD